MCLKVDFYNLSTRISSVDDYDIVEHIYRWLFDPLTVRTSTGDRKYSAIFMISGEIIIPAGVPRGWLLKELRKLEIEMKVYDKTTKFSSSKGVPEIKLRRGFKNKSQEKTYAELVDTMRKAKSESPKRGVICCGARTGAGKTYIVARFIAQHRVRTLAVFPMLELKKQFVDEMLLSTTVKPYQIVEVSTSMIESNRLPTDGIVYILSRQMLLSILKREGVRRKFNKFLKKLDFKLKLVDESHTFIYNTAVSDAVLCDLSLELHMSATPKSTVMDAAERRIVGYLIPQRYTVGGDEYKNFHTVYQIHYSAKDFGWTKPINLGPAWSSRSETRNIYFAKWLMKVADPWLRLVFDNYRYILKEHPTTEKPRMLFFCMLLEEIDVYTRWMIINKPDLKVGVIKGEIPVADRVRIVKNSDIVFATERTVGMGINYPITHLVCPIHFSDKSKVEQVIGRLRDSKTGQPRVAMFYECQSIPGSDSGRVAGMKAVASDFHQVTLGLENL